MYGIPLHGFHVHTSFEGGWQEVFEKKENHHTSCFVPGHGRPHGNLHHGLQLMSAAAQTREHCEGERYLGVLKLGRPAYLCHQVD